MKSLNGVAKVFLGLIISFISIASSCKKPGIDPPKTETPKSGITLSFAARFGSSDVAFKTGEYTRTNGEIMKINNLAQILSKVSLVKTDNSEVLLGDGYLFVDYVGQKTSFYFPNAPAGDYKGISFQLGLDSAINHGDPTAWPSDHPLNGNYTGLHWGWATGYIFQAIDGGYKKLTTDPDWNGVSLHTATDTFVRNYTILKDFTLVSGAHKTAKIQTQIDEFFMNPNTINFATDGSFSHSIGTTEVALMSKILENSFDVYSLVEVQ